MAALNIVDLAEAAYNAYIRDFPQSLKLDFDELSDSQKSKWYDVVLAVTNQIDMVQDIY